MTKEEQEPSKATDYSAALVANALVLGVIMFGAILHGYSKDLYYRSVQEDEYLEWASFWAFALATVVFAVTGIRQRRKSGVLPWFVAGLAIFSLFVALEEISWGQRLIGYRPPSYFLQRNFQQELNFHNIVDTDYRKLALKGVILGYGVLLPLIALIPPSAERLRRMAVVPPPLVLTPAFLATFVLYQIYPWSHTGEWVELMFGLCLLFSGIAGFTPRDRFDLRPLEGSPRIVSSALGLALVVLLGIGSAALLQWPRSGDPTFVAAAEMETTALKSDFLSGRIDTRCGLHKRLYTFMKEYRQDYLLEGDFSRLTSEGLAPARAEFFLDPWNSPYWLRFKCTKRRNRVSAFVYSFGPDRRRSSTDWQIGGDDIGAYIQLTEPENDPDGYRP